MILTPSTKTGSFAKKPHIKKGYYAGKLAKVDPYVDANGNLKDCTYGHQLILEFEVYKLDDDNNPTARVTVVEDGKEVEVSLAKFVYHEYKDSKTGEYRTALSAKSAITGTFEALGWKFSADPMDPESFIGNFVELNIDEYEYKDSEGKTKLASTINAIKKLRKVGEEEVAESKPEISEEERANIQAQLERLEESRKNETISEEGYKKAVEQLNAKLG